MRGDVVERGFIGSQPVGRDKQTPGEFVGLPFHPAEKVSVLTFYIYASRTP